MTRQAADVRDGAPVRGRQAYSRPVLRVYGSVGQLTQAGTGLSSETMANNGMASMSPNKRA